jgi:hypothetical protein
MKQIAQCSLPLLQLQPCPFSTAVSDKLPLLASSCCCCCSQVWQSWPAALTHLTAVGHQVAVAVTVGADAIPTASASNACAGVVGVRGAGAVAAAAVCEVRQRVDLHHACAQPQGTVAGQVAVSCVVPWRQLVSLLLQQRPK